MRGNLEAYAVVLHKASVDGTVKIYHDPLRASNFRIRMYLCKET